MLGEVIPFGSVDPLIESAFEEIETITTSVEDDLSNLQFAAQALMDRIKAVTL